MKTLIKEISLCLVLCMAFTSCNPYREVIISCTEGGSVYYHPDGSFESLQLEGTSITIEAVPDSWNGYEFVGWYVTGTDQLVSTEIIYTFTVFEDTYLEARFAKSPIVKICYTEGGKAAFKDYEEQVLQIQSGSVITVIATPYDYHHFTGWFIGDDKTPISTNECFTFTVTKDVILNAVFEPIQADSIVLEQDVYELLVGSTTAFGYKIYPNNAVPQDVIWHVGDTNVVSINSGIVVAKEIGETYIRVELKDTELYDECKVMVYAIEMTSISCLPEKIIERGECSYLEALYQPSDATIYNVLRWHSSDESVAVVNEKTGLITGLEIGECTITISNIYNTVTATCHLTVTPALVQDLSLSESFVYLPVGNSMRLYFSTEPHYAYNEELIKWESSNNSVAIVAEDGTITAIESGIATITASVLDENGCKAECFVVVDNESTLGQHVRSYLDSQLSISTDVRFPFGANYIVRNNGNEDVCLYAIKHTTDYGSRSFVVNETLNPGAMWEKWIESTEITWTFDMYGYKFDIRTKY